MSVLAPIPFASGTVVMVVVSTIWMLVHRRRRSDWSRSSCSRCWWSPTWCTSGSSSGHFTRAQHQLGEFSAGVHESFEGVQLVKSYGAEERETERLSGLADQVRVVTRARPSGCGAGSKRSSTSSRR